MSTSELLLPPTLEQINSRVSDICAFLDPPDVEDLFEYLIHRDREPSAKMIKVEKVALEFLAWQDARNQGGESFKAHGVKDRYNPATLPQGEDGKQKASRVRGFADDLRDKLDNYYLSRLGIPPLSAALDDPTENDVRAGRAKWEVYIAIPKRKGWKPIIQWRARSIRKPIETVRDTVDFKLIGTNVEALQYLAEQLHLIKQIEDTAIRWDPNKMPYPDLNGFRTALRARKVNYRLITGPVKYKAYMELLRTVYSEKPGENELLECYRLNRVLPLMNFTILYYLDSLQKPTEVLYGYGIKAGKNTVDDTPVFLTNNPKLVKEYKRLFIALREHPTSCQMSIDDPEFLDSDARANDIIATYDNFSDICLENLIKKEPRLTIKVCFTCTHEMARLIKIFQDNSISIESIQILLPTLDSKFLALREEALSSDPLKPYSLVHLVKENIAALQGLAPTIKTDVRQTRRLMPVMFFQIGSIIIYSPFWNGIPVATGPQSIVQANSVTGGALEKQFDALWTNSEKA